MARPPRIHVPGGFYHVTLRGNHQQDIFFSDADRELFKRIVVEVLERFTARVHAYCWMSNHVHLLIQVSDVPLGRLMLRIASRYARTVQSRLATTGHFFERRYHAILVDADAYLQELIRYIHLNPLRAGLVDDLAKYRWSSHHAYCGAGEDEWVTTDFALQMWHTERRHAIEAYRDFMTAGDSHDSLPIHPDDARILGKDDFLAKTVSVNYRPRSSKSLEDITAECCTRFSIPEAELISPSRARRLAPARAWLAHQAVREEVASVVTVARYLHRTESSLRELMLRHLPE